MGKYVSGVLETIILVVLRLLRTHVPGMSLFRAAEVVPSCHPGWENME